MHTECGALGLDDREFLDGIEAETGIRPDWEPGGFESLESGVREGVEQVRDDPALSPRRSADSSSTSRPAR